MDLFHSSFVLSSVGDHKIFVVSSVFFNPIRHNLSKHQRGYF